MRHIREELSSWILITLTTLFLFLISYSYSVAEEIRYPVACYEGEELARIRAWEKSTGLIGKKIDHTNVDQLKEFMHESYYNFFKYPDKWGNNYFYLSPYKPYLPFKEWVEWTKKGWGKPSVDENGIIKDHVAGTPFPNPKTGAEVMYNFETQPGWDDRRNKTDQIFLLDIRSGGERWMAVDFEFPKIAERVAVPPVPEYPNNKKDIRQCMMIYFWNPPEIQGLYELDLMYKDREREWDMWLWVPAIRRVRRMDTTQRQDHRGGGDFSLDDQNGWMGRIARNNYRLIGRKEVLMGRDNTYKDAIYEKGGCIWQNLKMEIINTYVIEVISKDPNYMYEKQIFYNDPEYWHVAVCERYDRQGRLWKFNANAYGRGTAPTGQEVSDYASAAHWDIQRKHASCSNAILDYDKRYELSYFSPANLNRLGR